MTETGITLSTGTTLYTTGNTIVVLGQQTTLGATEQDIIDIVSVQLVFAWIGAILFIWVGQVLLGNNSKLTFR